MAEQPLSGLNIVVTRPREQAAHLVREIERLGGHALLFPLLEIAPVADQAALRAQLSLLERADLAIFVSPNAVRYGMAAIGRLPARLRVASVGQGSAQALRALGIADIIAPTERYDSEGLLALPELQHMSGRRVLILRGDGGRELLGDTLAARGASVEYVTCYLRAKPQGKVATLLQASPHALTVTSSEALRHLNELCDPAQLAAVQALPLFVQHPRIAEAARQQGWRQVRETASGDDGLLGGLVAWAPLRSQ